MAFHFSNNGASIKITQEGNNFLILKQSIKDLSIMNSVVIKIKTDHQTFYFNHREVLTPATQTPIQLRDAINTWLSS